MPSSSRSLSVTDSYRQRLRSIRERVLARAEREWPTIERFDATRWPERMAVVVAGAQTEAVRAASGYLTAYLSSELGASQRTVYVDSRRYVGVSRDGRPLVEAFRSPVIGVLAALKDGKPSGEALEIGRQRATRMVGVDLDHAHRTAVLNVIDTDVRFTGWDRATAGTCGACLALAGTSGPHFDVHPGCQCVPAPRVRGVLDRVPLATAAVLFDRLSKAEQDERFGAEKAEQLRTGALAFTDLVQRSRLVTDQRDFITEAPVDPA